MELNHNLKLTTLATLIAAALATGCSDDNTITGTSSNDATVAGDRGARPDRDNRPDSDQDSRPGQDDQNSTKNEHDDNKEDGISQSGKSRKTAYYGDYTGDRVFVIDVSSMKIEKIIEHTGEGPYETDQVTKDYGYVLNRDDTSINVVSLHENKIESTIALKYKPRSIIPSPNGKQGLLTGKSEPQAAVIDLEHHEIRADGFGDSGYKSIADFGGGNATGHPYWISDRKFLLLDRTEKTIELYDTASATPLAKLATSSSVHHVFKVGNDYFGVLEGKRGATAQEAVSPGLVKFSIDEKHGKLKLQQEVLLNRYAGIPKTFEPKSWGAHHASLHPDGRSIYLGSYEGTMFVIDKDSLALKDSFHAGLGLGHVAFIPERNLAITTNHYAPFKTIVDVSDPANNRIIKNLTVANTDTAKTGKRLQSHTSHTDPDGKYFYSVSSLDGKFYAIDLAKLEVSDSVTMPGAYPLMGALVTDTTDGEKEREHLNHL